MPCEPLSTGQAKPGVTCHDGRRAAQDSLAQQATSWPESLDTVYGSALAFAARVRDMSGGRFTITPYAAGELVPGLQVPDAVRSGSEAMDRLFGEFGVLGFPAGNTGPQMGGWFKQQVETVADLQGLKTRIPGLGGERDLSSITSRKQMM